MGANVKLFQLPGAIKCPQCGYVMYYNEVDRFANFAVATCTIVYCRGQGTRYKVPLIEVIAEEITEEKCFGPEFGPITKNLLGRK